MSVRTATIRVITCDTPDCNRIAVPAQLAGWHRDAHRRALHLSHAVDAFTTAEAEGWVRQTRGYGDFAYYCPDHKDFPERPEPIREPRTTPARTIPVHRRPESTIVDVPLPTSDH